MMATLARPRSVDAGWPMILLIVGAGVVSACQVGKAPMALAAVRGDLGLDLATVSWLISAFAIIGALIGAPMGLAIDRLGARRVVVAGLVLQALGSALGGSAPGAASLLATRVIEGLGFLGVVVAAPALITAAVRDEDRKRAMALWATFMPVGMTVVMLAAPLLSLLAWRGFWWLNAAVLLGYAIVLDRLLVVASPDPRQDAHEARPTIRQAIGAAMAAPGPWILAGLFAAFTASFFAALGFLPTLLVDWFAIDAATASQLSALAIAASGLGNLACGQMLARGARPRRLLAAAFVIQAVCAVVIFAPMVPRGLAYATCLVFSFTGGLIPVVIFDAAPRAAPDAGLVGATLGMAMQGNNLGLLLGPALAGWLAGTWGWPAVAGLIGLLTLLALPLVAALSPARAGTGQPGPGPGLGSGPGPGQRHGISA